MTLAELLENKFRGDIRYRGAAYLKAERVSITRVSPEHIFGLVRDGVEYQTQITRDDNELRMFCNCSSGQPEVTCKHLWATILAADESGYVSASVRPGYIPPFAVAAPPTLSFEDEDLDDEFERDTFQPSVTAGRGGTATAEPKPPKLQPWENRLVELKQQLTTVETGPSKAEREQEVFYEIDLEQSRAVRQLVLQTSQRQRRANGQWGKLKALKLRAGRTDEVQDGDDRRILAYLLGGTPERSNWYAQQAETQSAIHRFRVPFELCELVLPLLCRTGRMRFLDNDDPQIKSLHWDDGPPWELTMRVEFDDTEDVWTLHGMLQRDETRLDVADCHLLVPGGLVFHRDTISRLNDFGAFAWVDLLREGDVVNVPDGEEHALVDRLLDMPVMPRLELPESLQLEEVHCDPAPQLVIRAPSSSRWHLERLQGEVFFDYLGTQLSGSSLQWAIVQREEGRCIQRNRAAEEQAWLQLQEAGFRRLLDQRRGSQDVEVAARDLGPAVRNLINQGWTVRAGNQQVRQPAEPRFRVESGIDWFELHADIDFEGRTLPFPELLSALARGDSTVRLDDGSLGIIPEEWLQDFSLLSGLGQTEEGHVRFSHNQVTLLDALLATQSGVEFDEDFVAIRERFRNFSGVASAREPANFQGELRTYQRDGLGWLNFLKEFNFGGCLADDMGLGKTVQLLALLQERVAERDESLPSLVVVPKSLLFNWRQECQRFTPNLRSLEYIGLDRAPLREDFPQHDVIFTTYGTLRRDVLELRDVQFDYIVLDEAQTIKNASSQIAKASRLLKANHRVALSGTPIENHLGDLWSIFEFLNPGMLGRSSVFKQFASDASDDESRGLLANGLRPFILRRTKQQVASELPEKLEETIVCDMGEDQRRLYDELRAHYRDSLLGMVKSQGLGKSKMHVLEALLRLRQAACHPGLLDKKLARQKSAKLDAMCPMLEEILEEGHKALVFSQFTSMLSLVKKKLDHQGITYEYLDGQTRNRKARVERFQNDADCGVFLISLKAGGLGLNLTAADYVFLLDPWWNPAVEAQAIDRAHRVGQTRQVFAYRLICRDTVEEKIAALQNQKRKLADAILETDSASILKQLSTEDLELLLS